MKWIMPGKRAEKRWRQVLFLCLILIFGGAATGCKAVPEQSSSERSDGKISVVTTIFPQYDFVRQIAGDKVELKMLLKPGEESHSYEPTPQDILSIQNCDLFVYVGGENDEWVEDILSSLNMGKMETLRLVDCVNTVEEEHIEGMKEERHEHEEAEGEYDEHVWTSPLNAMKIVDDITALLCQIDPPNAEVYRQNEKSYDGKLKKLDEEFRDAAEHSARQTLLFGDRFPFRYFADAYGLTYYAAFPGCASDTEPSAATMAYLINKVRDENIPLVLKMELSSDHIAEAIAEATGTKVGIFYSCHNVTAQQFQNGETYLSMMERNVETLKEALADGAN